ncbi:hypothetical protein [Streptomyces virginiae]|uniref:hypothetical protein n=1 Tax=Streptomyces virginiae TaxID=1961 RepID=UPI00343FBC1F
MSSTGPVTDRAGVPGLLEPFRRRAEGQHTAGEGADSGLSIAASIAASIARPHEAELRAGADPGPEGGLMVRVRFPVPGVARTSRTTRTNHL